MRKEDILAELAKHSGTIFDFPDRGEWGNNRYRGNTSGWVIASLIDRYDVKKLAELFSGGGTGYDVAKDMGIQYVGADLNPTPVRPNILCVNAITDDVPEEFLDADLLFAHPPYSSLIQIPYSGSMYADPDGSLSRYDLGQMNWPEFMDALNKVIMKYYAAMKPNSRMAIQMGDVRRSGRCYSMLRDIVKPGALENIIVKRQHNCVSDGRTYSKRNFYMIEHEFIYVLRKEGGYVIGFQLPKEYKVDLRNSRTATWRDVLSAVMDKLKEASLSEIYGEIENYDKCKANPHYKEKVRQTLQLCNRFVPLGNGRWKVAA